MIRYVSPSGVKHGSYHNDSIFLFYFNFSAGPTNKSKLDHLALSLLLPAELEVLGSLDRTLKQERGSTTLIRLAATNIWSYKNGVIRFKSST